MSLLVKKLAIFIAFTLFLSGCQQHTQDEKVVQYKQNKEEIEKLDILAIGNSDLYSGFNPMQLWHETGMTAFNAGAPMLNMKLSYEMMKLAFTYHSPKVLLLEVDMFFDKREKAIEPEGYAYTAKKYCYPLLKNTSEWEKIKQEKFYNESRFPNRMLYGGFYYNNTVEPYYDGFSYMNQTKKKGIVSMTTQYLPHMIELAKQNQCEVLFVWLPSQTTATSKRHQMVQKLADQYEVPFIDFNTNQYNTNFSWLTDSRDAGNHLNYSGATKMTHFLGQYISQNYSIEDKRQSQTYKQYNELYDEYMSYIQKQ